MPSTATKRRRCHFSTLVVALLASAVLASINFPGNRMLRVVDFTDVSAHKIYRGGGIFYEDSDTPQQLIIDPVREHGWPLTYLTRRGKTSEQGLGGISPGDDRTHEWSLVAVAINFAVTMAIATAIAGVWEWRRRRCARLMQLTLFDCFALTLFAAVLLGLWQIGERRLAALRAVEGRKHFVEPGGEMIEEMAAVEEQEEEPDLDRIRLRRNPPLFWIGELSNSERARVFEEPSFEVQRAIDRYDNKTDGPNDDEATLQIERLAKLHALESFEIDGPDITDVALEKLHRLPPVQCLVLVRCHKLTDVGLAYVGRLKGLRFLDIHDTPIDGSGLATLAGSRLEGLRLVDTAVNDEALAHIGKMRHLEGIEISGGRVTGAGIAQLRNLDRLRVLLLVNVAVDDAGLRQLSRLTNLRTLFLVGTAVKGRAFAELAGWSRLSQLCLDDSPITSATIKQFNQYPALSHMTLWRTPVRPPIMSQLKEARPALKIEGFDRQREDIERVVGELLAYDPAEFRVVDVGLFRATGLGPRHFGDEEMALLANAKALEKIDLAASHVTDEGMIELKGASNLRRLDLSGTHVTGTGLAHLSGLNQLAELRLNATHLSREGIEQLCSLKTLTKLAIAETRVTDAEVAEIVKQLPRLTHLDLANTRITPAVARSLTAAKKLEVNIWGPEFTRTALEDIQSQCPSIKVVSQRHLTDFDDER